MRAIILAAGRGLRLQQPENRQLPKSLLRFDGKSLLERHLILLRSAGVEEIVLALGFRRQLIEDELERLRWTPRPEIVVNEQFELGSVLTVHTAAPAMRRGGEVLLMDADVLYDGRILSALTTGQRPVNRLLIDRDFETGDELFIFGFSRGAYTARSLSGLISKCGLLRAGAPLSVKQLYDRKRVSDKTYARLHAILGDEGMVELVGILGYYAMIAMLLDAFRMPVPPGAPMPFAEPR